MMIDKRAPRRRITVMIFFCIASAAGCGVLNGCTSVNPVPFAKYRSAVQEAQSGIDNAMSVNYAWTRSGYIESFSNDPNSRFTQLMIQPGQGYDWSMPKPPLYLTVKKVRSSMAELNQAFANYADLLAKLASDDLTSTVTFDQMAKDINQNATDAANALGLSASQDGIALFSTAASEAARLYIEKHRRHYLQNAIESNQSNVAEYSAQCVSLIHIIRGNVKAYYAERTEPIRKAWNETAGAKRQKSTEAMLDLNEQYVDIMRVLQELEETYKALPVAHADLAKGITKSKFDAAGIQKLYSSAKRLQQLFNELK
jgi:hypothetical protein